MEPILKKYFSTFDEVSIKLLNIEAEAKHIDDFKRVGIPKKHFESFKIIVAAYRQSGKAHRSIFNRGKPKDIREDILRSIKFFKEDLTLKDNQSITRLKISIDIKEGASTMHKDLKLESRAWAEYFIDAMMKQVKDDTFDFYETEAEPIPKDVGGRKGDKITYWQKNMAKELNEFIISEQIFEDKTNKANAIITILDISGIRKKTKTPLKALNHLLK